MYLPGRKAAEILGLHQNTLREYADSGKISCIRTESGQRRYDVDSYLRGVQPAPNCLLLPGQFLQAAGRPAATGCLDGGALPGRRDHPGHWRRASTGSEKGLYPYWSDFIAGISSALWLPTGTDWPALDLRFSSGLPRRMAGRSWFSATRTTAPSRSSPRIYLPSFTPSPAGCTAFGGTARLSRRIRLLSDTGAESDTAPVV